MSDMAFTFKWSYFTLCKVKFSPNQIITQFPDTPEKNYGFRCKHFLKNSEYGQFLRSELYDKKRRI